VWNPWAELTAKLADMEPEGWHGMLCVETANAGENAVTLAPGAVHTMRAIVSVERAS
jgi:glucose-6-phosphate 1-epimerase